MVTDEQCKQRNGNPEKELRRNGKDKNIVTEMKNGSGGLISRWDMTEEIINEPGDVATESSKSFRFRVLDIVKTRRTKPHMHTHYMQGLEDNYKRCNMYEWGYQVKKKERKRRECLKYLRISPKMSDIKPQIHEAQSTPSRINEQKTTPQHIISKLWKIKDKEKKVLKKSQRKTAPCL